MVYLPHWPIPKSTNDVSLGLERMQKLLLNLGNPHNNLPPVIHVAGTNGKGSTIAFIKSILENAGYIVHRYTSPHIKNFNERIMLAGREISDAQLYQLSEEVRLKVQDCEYTFFEATTAMAFLAFSRVKADVLLLETGMGGRLDATNVVANPLITVITPISLDHMEFLGDNIASIAYEKSGIIKKDSPCVVSWQPKDAMEVIKKRCLELNAEIHSFAEQWNIESSIKSFKFINNFDQETIELKGVSLLGIHQILNAATAIATVKKLNTFKISNENIQAGVANTFWPARMEFIKHGKLKDLMPPAYELWVDGAHNAGGALMIAETIRATWNDMPTYLINGRTGKRDVKSFLEPFKGVVSAVYAVKVRSEPIAESSKNIFLEAQKLGFEAYDCESIEQAIVLILEKTNIPARILICGSLYLAADVMMANKN